MQLIGIYINKHNPEITKNLLKDWYPFGNFEKCHGLTDFSNIEKQLQENKYFVNKFYNINQENGVSGPSINLNCIVGKNGSGKSTILSLVYRIINNVACKLKEQLPDLNIDYEPSWAWGFEAELYYEIGGKICYIQIADNSSKNYSEERKKNLPVKVIVDNKDILDRNSMSNQDYLREIGKYIFYSIGTNYSLYSNVAIRDEYDEIQEDWLSTLYHKNDGYFTPVVLVPYKYSSSSIDTEKELKLANERVNTLALLMYFSSEKSAFVENLFPGKMIYSLKSEEEYKKEIDSKYDDLIDDIIDDDIQLDKKEQIYAQCNLRDEVEKLWRVRIKQNGNKTIYENMILYLTYKIIKMFIYYDKYKKLYGKKINLLEYFYNNESECKELFKKAIYTIDKEQTDFSNLKIKQCLKFIDNELLYLDIKYQRSENQYSVNIDDLNAIIKTKTNYDSIFVDLLPPFFFKRFYYEKSLDEKTTGDDLFFPISSMSSGEQQILYSLSYAIYHMKNAANNQYEEDRIPYRNINLIFDEAELYYHPEYQRQFIDKLLAILKRSHFEKDIDSINITIVTHSPFILSDIPKSNIVALREGNVESLGAETLGSNIYDLLSEQFFMNSSIGAHVETIINEIVQDFYIKKTGKDKKRLEIIQEKYKNSEFYYRLANQIGDEYLRNTLSEMIDYLMGQDYQERRIHDYERRRDEYDKKIEKLRNEKN